MNVATILAAAAADHADRPALLVDGGSVSFADLDARASGVAALLQDQGVAAGDRVALMLPNGTAFVAAFFGILRAGAIAVPLNILLAPPEVETRIALSGAKLLLDDETAPISVEVEPVVRDDGDAAVILFTSGTSGAPKGAVITHGSLRTAAENAAEAMALGPDDVVLGAAPFSHVLGLSTGILATLSRGSAIAVERRFEPEGTLARMCDTGTTILLGVPTMCIALCQAARSVERLPPLRLAHVGGAAVPVEVGREFERVFGADLYEGYGLTEMSGIATTYTQGQLRKPGSVGMPLGGTEIRIVEEEVQFRGPSVVTRYWEDVPATTPDGWLATGDIGYLDEDGYLFLVDRKKELVIRGGYNVYPREVEEVLYAHPDVLEVAVIGIPHETLGEEVAAVVVRRPGADVDKDELQAWAKERVAAYKYPRVISFVDELPKTATGKILKRAIDRDSIR